MKQIGYNGAVQRRDKGGGALQQANKSGVPVPRAKQDYGIILVPAPDPEPELFPQPKDPVDNAKRIDPVFDVEVWKMIDVDLPPLKCSVSQIWGKGEILGWMIGLGFLSPVIFGLIPGIGPIAMLPMFLLVFGGLMCWAFGDGKAQVLCKYESYNRLIANKDRVLTGSMTLDEFYKLQGLELEFWVANQDYWKDDLERLRWLYDHKLILEEQFEKTRKILVKRLIGQE